MAWYFIEMEHTNNLSSFLMTTFVCVFSHMVVLKMRHAFILSFDFSLAWYLFYLKISVVIVAVAVAAAVGGSFLRISLLHANDFKAKRGMLAVFWLLLALLFSCLFVSIN